MRRLFSAVVAVTAIGLSGCAGGGLGLFGSSSDPQATPGAATQTASADQPRVASRNIVDFDPDKECPQIKVPAGASAYQQAGGGQIAMQASLQSFARECTLETGQTVTIKIGVRGLVKLGESGRPGTYTVPLRITVRDLDGKAVSSDVQRIRVAVSGQHAPFQYVASPVSVPISFDRPLRSYELLVGFDQRG